MQIMPQRPIDEETLNVLRQEIQNELKTMEKARENTMESRFNNTAEWAKDTFFQDENRYRRQQQAEINRANRELNNEMRAYLNYQQNSQGENTRLALLNILEDASRQGYTPQDVNRILNQLEQRQRLSGRMRQWMNTPEGKGFTWGIGATLAAGILLPALTSMVKPALKKVVEGAVSMTEYVQDTAAHVRDEFEDMVAEAQFENMKQSMEKDLSVGSEGDIH